MLQLEIPMETVEAAMDLAVKNDKKVGIYASPAKRLSREVIQNATFIVAKSNELSTIF